MCLKERDNENVFIIDAFSVLSGSVRVTPFTLTWCSNNRLQSDTFAVCQSAEPLFASLNALYVSDIQFLKRE